MTIRNLAIAAGLLASSLSLAAVVHADNHAVSGEVVVDGSSTVAPISIAASESFRSAEPGVQVPVGTSGSGGGFAKFCVGETDISNASRPIKQSEIDTCTENGIEFVEIPVAFDGLAVVVNSANDYTACLTVDQLNYIWNADAEGEVLSWADLNAEFGTEFEDESLELFAPGDRIRYLRLFQRGDSGRRRYSG